MEHPQARLDSEELLHLALHAVQGGRHEQALCLLKQANEQDPNDAVVVYFLGAQHAQLGLFDRALSEMARAIELRPDFHIARLQLGLLCLSVGLADRAREALDPLARQPEQACLHHFAQGLIHLLNDAFAECKAELERGIVLNADNVPLNDDMRRLIETIDATPAAAASGQAAADVEAGAPTPDGGKNLWLSSYRRSRGSIQ